VSVCSERCGFCGRCDRALLPERRARPALDRADFLAIHRGFQMAGLDRDYFGYDDIVYLWRQGKDAEQIVAIAVEHADRAIRLQTRKASA
jgi:uncharacterized protein (DUF2336 family)